MAKCGWGVNNNNNNNNNNGTKDRREKSKQSRLVWKMQFPNHLFWLLIIYGCF